MHRQADDLLDVFFPPVCGLCGQPADSDDRLVCVDCWETIKGMESPYCSECKNLLYDERQCPICRPAPLIIFSLGPYEGSLQKIIHDLKFSGLKPLARSLGRKIAELILPRIDSLKIDLIVPVPLHDSRLYIRGFNQAEEIGRAIGDIMGIPIIPDTLYTVRKTRQQARLPARQREANVKGAYAVDDENGLIMGKTILLVDDVTTTGATLRENTAILKKASAGKIIGAVAATAMGN